jgi:hypothetical protein
MTAVEKCFMGLRETSWQVHVLVPAIGDGHQSRIERTAQTGDDIWQRVFEVFVLATAKAVTSHDDLRAKRFGTGIQRADFIAGLMAYKRLDNRAAILIELLL